MGRVIRQVDQQIPHQATVASMDSLDEIMDWLGTFRERLRLARDTDRPDFEAILNRLEARHKERRAELA